MGMCKTELILSRIASERAHCGEWVNIYFALPLYGLKWVIVRMNWDQPIRRLNIDFGQEGACDKLGSNGSYVIYCGVGERAEVSVNIIINTFPVREGKVSYELPFSSVVWITPILIDVEGREALKCVEGA